MVLFLAILHNNKGDNMNQFFNTGDIIYGFCNGYFGRDDYEKKTCVFVTWKYAVFEYSDGSATVLNYSQNFNLETIEKWKKGV